MPRIRSGFRAGSMVGTASLRRGAMVKRLRPDLKISLLRGNVETRLAKVAKGEAAATLLALAGLKRLGLEARATAVLDVRDFVPAAGQGAIAITMRTGDDATRALLAPVLDEATAIALAAERAFLRVLDGSCKTPIGAHARIERRHDLLSRHCAQTRWLAVFRDGGIRRRQRRGLARRSGRQRSRGANSRRVFRLLERMSNASPRPDEPRSGQAARPMSILPDRDGMNRRTTLFSMMNSQYLLTLELLLLQ